MNKTHWKKAFNKDFLGAHDLEENQELKVIIKNVQIKPVKDTSGKENNCNVAFFTDTKIKPMVLNATNCKLIKKFSKSNYIEDWKNIPIQIYVKEIKAFGEVVEALRIREKQPNLKKPVLSPESDKWNKAIESYRKSKNIAIIKKYYDISAENEKLLINKANEVS
jgi:hypothetical protein